MTMIKENQTPKEKESKLIEGHIAMNLGRTNTPESEVVRVRQTIERGEQYMIMGTPVNPHKYLAELEAYIDRCNSKPVIIGVSTDPSLSYANRGGDPISHLRAVKGGTRGLPF